MFQGLKRTDFSTYEVFAKTSSIQRQPLVQVICLTYGHAAFILQTLNGFFIQKTSFDFEILIFDDCSPDETKQLVVDQISNHPEGDRIRYFKQKHNLGPNINGMFALQQLTAKYAALCEGDDYWIDSEKLETQIVFLEKNPAFSLTFHDTLDLFQDGTRRKFSMHKRTKFVIEDFVIHTYARTLSVIFRRPPFEWPKELNTINLGDSALFIYLLQFGDAFYFDRVMGCYRMHEGGFWSSKQGAKRACLRFEMFIGVKHFIQPDFVGLIEKQIWELSLAYSKASFSLFEFRKGVVGLREFLLSPLSFKVSKIKRTILRILSKSKSK